ncbi:hypothetical protein MMC22_000478 [Lobaria immixta]|nr:hypothetical protein [Lobaria immixta]
MILMILHLLVIILNLYYWMLEKSIESFLSLALAIVALQPFSNNAIDKRISNGHQIQASPAPVIADPEMYLSEMDIQRLVEMEHRRDVRISVVEKGRRRQLRQKHVDEVRDTKCLEMLRGLVKECHEPMEEMIKDFQPKDTSVDDPEELGKMLKELRFESTSLALGFICPAPQLERPELSPPPTYSDVVLPTEALSPNSPSIDLTLAEFASTIKTDPRIQAVQAKMAIQNKVCEESKSRVSKVVRALQNSWKRRPRKWVKAKKHKAKKQGGKALKIASAKLDALRREEEGIWAEIRDGS